MPAPIAQEVKDLARSLWEQGTPTSSIAAELDLHQAAIRKMASRGKWSRPGAAPASPAANHLQESTPDDPAAPVAPAPIAPGITSQAPVTPAVTPAVAVTTHCDKPAPQPVNHVKLKRVGLAITSSGLQARDRIRDALGAEILRQLTVLQAEPIESAHDLRNTRERQGLAAVAKTLADAAGSIFDFQEHTTGMVWAAELARPAVVKPTADCVIELPAESESHKPLPLQDRQLNDPDIVRSIGQAQDQAVSPGQPAQEPPGASMLSGQPGAAPPPP